MNIWLNIEERIIGWLVQDFQARYLRQAAQRAYEAFVRQHPLLSESLFDEHFLMRGAAPLLRGYLNAEPPEPAALARAWTEQMWYRDERMQLHLINQLLPIASDFLRLVDMELADLKGGATLRARVV